MKKILINRMTPKEKANSLSEVRLLSAIAHPNIVSLVDVFYDEFIESLWYVLCYSAWSRNWQREAI
jgi:serine/threonine protein kinase